VPREQAQAATSQPAPVPARKGASAGAEKPKAAAPRTDKGSEAKIATPPPRTAKTRPPR
jgi:hypothetical protein